MWKGLIGDPCIEECWGKGVQLKTTSLLIFFLWLVKSKNPVNNRLVDHGRNVGFILISSIILSLLDQLQIFWQLYLMVLLGILNRFRALNRSRTTWNVALDIPKTFDKAFGILVFFTSLCLEFQVRHLALFCLFLLVDNFKGLWMGSPHQNIQLILEFFKTLFLIWNFR